MPSAARSLADSFVEFSADVSTDAVRSHDLDRIVLDPAGLGQDLFVFELVAPDLGAVVVEDHAAGAGGALVDSRDEFCQLPAPLLTAASRPSWTTWPGEILDIDRMPRGGPDASCVDRLLETDRLEYLDRDDVDDEACKRSVIRALEWTGEVFGNTEKFAQIALDEVADVPDPKILELGAGHGGLSRKLLDWHPTAELTVTDVEAASVAGDRSR